MNKLRSLDGRVAFDKHLKLTLTGIVGFAGLAISFFGYISVQEEGLLFGYKTHNLLVTKALFYSIATIYAVLIIYFFVMIVLAVQARVHRRPRFLFFVVPTIVSLVSISVGILIGSIGPFGRDASAFVYFVVLYNTYVYLLLWGLWPVEDFSGTSPSEGTKILPEDDNKL